MSGSGRGAGRAAVEPRRGGESLAARQSREGGARRTGQGGLSTAALGFALLEESSGRALAADDRAAWERRLGEGLAGTRFHTDPAAARAAARLDADAFTTGDDVYFGAASYEPATARGTVLIAHELAHVVQQRRDGAADSDASLELAAAGAAADVVRGRPTRVAGRAPRGTIQRQRRGATVPLALDPHARLSENAERLRTEALPAFQRGLDAVDEAAVRDARLRILALWATVEGANAELRTPGGPDRPEYVDIRKAVLAGVTTQVFRGAGVVGPTKPVEYAGETTDYLARQTEETATTVKDAATLQGLLAKQPVPYEDQETAVRLLAAHPNPWQLGYLLAVLRAAGLEGVLDTFGFDTHDDVQAILASQAFTLKREFVGPGDRIGLLEPVASELKVRVLRPYGARELALELYGDYSFYESVLVPYNRGALGRTRPEGLVPAGTELLIEPRLAWGKYKLAFAQVERMRRQVDRPYIDAAPGGVVVGTTSRYTVRWPVPPEPEGAWRLSTGESVWAPTTSLWEWAEVEWSVETDPAVVREKGVPAEETLDSRAVRMETLTKEGLSIDHSWPDLGTHTVRCTVLFGAAAYPTEIKLRYAQAVVTQEEKLEAEWPTVADPRLHPEELGARFAETYGDFQRAVAELGVTEEELAENPRLATRITTSYYPEFLLRDLRRQREMTANKGLERKLAIQIELVEKAIERTKTWPMRPISALWVSSAEEHTASMPLALYVAPDPDAPAAFPFALRVWDFTIPGQAREYTDGHGAWTASQGLHGVLEAFANESPYPDGTVRFALEPILLPADFAGPLAIPRETLDLHTHGGTLMEKLAPGLMLLALATVGFMTLQPEIVVLAIGLYGAYQGLADIAERLEDGTFDWDLRTGLDILAIAGGVAGVVSPVVSGVRGVGAVAWFGTTTRVVGLLQIGVMVGTHSKQIVEAHESGDWEKIADAWLSAAIDGALIAVMHKATATPSEELGPRAAERPPEGAGARVSVDPFRPAEGRASTSVGIGGKPPAGAPPVEEPAGVPREQTPRATHEQWAAGVAERGLGPRPGPAEPAGPPVGRGTYETVRGERTFTTPETAFGAYDEAVTRAGGREVGIYRNVDTGEYVVRVGDEHSVSEPYEGRWESVLHRHPNPENVLTRRMPAPQDVHNALVSAVRAGRAITEFIDYPLPDGRQGLVAYTVEPAGGRVTIKYELTDGTKVARTFESIEAYASHYAERTTYVDPKSPEYPWMMQDLNDFYANRPSSGATAVGTLKPAEAPPEALAKPPPVEGAIEHRGAVEQARAAAKAGRALEIRERALREAAADPLVQQGLDNLAKMFNAAKGDEVLAAAAPEQLGAFLRALADPDVVAFRRPAFYAELARRPQAIEFAQSYGAKALRNLALRYGWGHTLLSDVLPRATARLEGAATAAERASIRDGLSDSRISASRLDALLGKEPPAKPPRPPRPTKANMGVDRNLKSWQLFYESEERAAAAHGEKADPEVLKLRADVLQIYDRAKSGAFKSLTPESRTQLVDRFDELAARSGMPRYRINALRGNLSEWLRRSAPGARKVGFLAGNEVSPSTKGATVPDDAIAHDDHTEWIEQKSDWIDRGKTTKSGAYEQGVAAARDYLKDARLDRPNLPEGDTLSIDFIRDPGPVTRDEMLRILLSDDTVARVRFGTTWYDRSSVK